MIWNLIARFQALVAVRLGSATAAQLASVRFPTRGGFVAVSQCGRRPYPANSGHLISPIADAQNRYSSHSARQRIRRWFTTRELSPRTPSTKVISRPHGPPTNRLPVGYAHEILLPVDLARTLFFMQYELGLLEYADDLRDH